MGRDPLPWGTNEIQGRRVNAKQPWEDPAEGCPGGWYRSRFYYSLAPFLRLRADGGQRVSNPLFDRCEDELVVRWVLYLESEQEAAETERAAIRLKEA